MGYAVPALPERPHLRALRRQRGYTSAALFGQKVGLSPGQVYDLDRQQTTVTDPAYRNILNIFGLEDGALKATGNACPYCGHAETEDRKPHEEVPNGT